MKKYFLPLAFLTLFLMLAGPVLADGLTIQVVPAIAPNAFGSPSWGTWVSNAVYALQYGYSAYGTPGTPSYYQAISTPISGNQILVTSFPSWNGVVNPTGAFASELGNRLHFGLLIYPTTLGSGTQFSISQLAFTLTGTDPSNALGFSFLAGSYNYGSGYIGVQAGPDGILGTGDDVYITSGPNTQLVDALIGRGSGNAYWPCGPGDPLPCATPAQMQAAMNAAASYGGGPYTLTGTYTLNGYTGLGSVQVNPVANPVPEPSSLSLFGTGLALFISRLRRRSWSV